MTEIDAGTRDERIDRVETKVETLTEKIDQILGIVGKRPAATNDDDAPGPNGRPASVEEQVRAELARAEQERADAAAAEDEKSDREQVKAQLAKLQEAPPVRPQPRSQRAIWGRA